MSDGFVCSSQIFLPSTAAPPSSRTLWNSPSASPAPPPPSCPLLPLPSPFPLPSPSPLPSPPHPSPHTPPFPLVLPRYSILENTPSLPISILLGPSWLRRGYHCTPQRYLSYLSLLPSCGAGPSFSALVSCLTFPDSCLPSGEGVTVYRFSGSMCFHHQTIFPCFPFGGSSREVRLGMHSVCVGRIPDSRAPDAVGHGSLGLLDSF